MSDTRMVSTKLWGWVDLVYSSDDGGWYGHRMERDAAGKLFDFTTRIFRSQTALLKALKNPKLRWTCF